MKSLLRFALRELGRIYRHKGFLFLVLLWPLIYAFFFGRVYQNRVLIKLPMAVADQDHSQLSRMLIRYLEASRSFELVRTVENPADIEDLIANDEVMVGIVIPRHLENTVKRSRSERIIAFVNSANLSIGNLAIAEIRSVVGTVSAGIQLKYLMKTGSSSARALHQIQAVKIESARLHNPAFSYLNFIVPGLWAAILHQLLILFGALAFVREFELGRKDELWSLAQNKAWNLVAGKILPYLVIGLLLFCSYFLVLFPIFDLAPEVFLARIVLFSIPFVLASLAYGFVFSVLPRDSLGSMKVVLLLTGPAFTLSGFVWPIDAMPTPLQYLAHIIPLTPFVSGFRKLIQEGAPLESVWQESGQLLLMAVIALILATLFLHRSRKKELSV